MKHSVQEIKEVCALFRLYGSFVTAIPYGGGHINDTYQVAYNQGGTLVHYTLQRINTNVFKKPLELMDNIERVIDHIYSKIEDGQFLQLVKSHENRSCVYDVKGDVWRCYVFIEHTCTKDIIENEQMAFQAAKTFGRFQRELFDFSGERLYEVIPNFHHTPSRLADLKRVAEKDEFGRLKLVEKEFDFVLKREQMCGVLLELNRQGDIPERITHNDTKLNNVLLDVDTFEGVAVIDLDTTMPGLIHYDFGDMLRTGTSPAAEDEQDLSKVYMRFEMYEALLRGYLSQTRELLTPAELDCLPFAGKLITLEIGIRFLTDYLEGDIYFKTHRDGHNLDRCRTQFKLLSSMEEQDELMKNLLHKII